MTSSIPPGLAFAPHVSPPASTIDTPVRRKWSTRNPIPASFLVPNGDLVPTDSVSNGPHSGKSVVRSPSTKSNYDYGSSPVSTFRSRVARNNSYSRAASSTLRPDRLSELDLIEPVSMSHHGTEPFTNKTLIKAGWLWRRGSMLQWKRFYVRAYSNGMTAGCIDFSINEHGASAPAKSLDLAICTQVIEKLAKPTSTRFEFQLMLSRSEMLLAADSVAECSAWITAIQTLIPRIVQPGLERIGAELEGATATVAHLSLERSEIVAHNVLLQQKISDLEEQVRAAKSEAAAARREQLSVSEACRRGSDIAARELTARIEAQNDYTQVINVEAERTRTALSIAHEHLSNRQAEIVSAISNMETSVIGEVFRTGDSVTQQVADAVAELVKKFIARETAHSDRTSSTFQQIASRIEDGVQCQLKVSLQDVIDQTRATVRDSLSAPLAKIENQNNKIALSLAELAGSNNDTTPHKLGEIIGTSIDQVKKELKEAHDVTVDHVVKITTEKMDELVTSMEYVDTMGDRISTTVADLLLSKITGLVAENHSTVEKANESLAKVLQAAPNISQDVVERVSALLQITESFLNDKIDKASAESQLKAITDRMESIHSLMKDTSHTADSSSRIDFTAVHLTDTITRQLANMDKKVTRTHDNDHRLLLSIEERLDRLVQSAETLKRTGSSHTDKLNKGLTLLEESKQANGWSGRGQFRSTMNSLELKLDQVLAAMMQKDKEPSIRHIDSGNFQSNEMIHQQIPDLERHKRDLECQVGSLTHQVDTLFHQVKELSAQRHMLIHEIRSYSHLEGEVSIARKELDAIKNDFALFEQDTIVRVQRLVCEAQELEESKPMVSL